MRQTLIYLYTSKDYNTWESVQSVYNTVAVFHYQDEVKPPKRKNWIVTEICVANVFFILKVIKIIYTVPQTSHTIESSHFIISLTTGEILSSITFSNAIQNNKFQDDILLNLFSIHLD